MKPFRFTLEALRTLRQRAEQSAQEKYAQTLLERSRSLEKMAQLDHELTLARQAWQQHAAAGCTAAQLAQEQLHCAWLDGLCRQAENHLALVERDVLQKLKDLAKAQGERELLDRFHDRHREAYDRKLAQAEQKNLDDMVSGRFGLNARQLQLS
jgi:flagellar export protein FliJ